MTKRQTSTSRIDAFTKVTKKAENSYVTDQSLFCIKFNEDVYKMLVEFLDTSCCHQLRLVCKYTHRLTHYAMVKLERSFWLFSFEKHFAKNMKQLHLEDVMDMDIKALRPSIKDEKCPTLHNQLIELAKHIATYNNTQDSLFVFRLVPIVVIITNPEKHIPLNNVNYKVSFFLFTRDMEQYWKITLLPYFTKYYKSLLKSTTTPNEKPEIMLYIHLSVRDSQGEADLEVQNCIAYKRMPGVARIKYNYDTDHLYS